MIQYLNQILLLLESVHLTVNLGRSHHPLQLVSLGLFTVTDW